MADKVVAELRLKDVAHMSYEEKLEISFWLQKQAVGLFTDGDKYTYNFQARYLK